VGSRIESVVALPLFVLSELLLKRLEVGRVMAEQASRTTSGQNLQNSQKQKLSKGKRCDNCLNIRPLTVKTNCYTYLMKSVTIVLTAVRKPLRRLLLHPFEVKREFYLSKNEKNKDAGGGEI
jgi:hypothetical protein